MRLQTTSIGIDFGTTNSSVALVTPGAAVELASFSFMGAQIPSFRSVLYIEQTKAANGIKRSHSLTGPAAIEHYAQILGALRWAGLDPLVTLYHWTHPLSLGLDLWLDPESP